MAAKRVEDSINPEKSASRVAINAFMIGSLFMVLTVIWTLGPQKFNPFIIWQLVLAIPLIFISSLAYVKVGYRDKSKVFDRFGWLSHTLGNDLVLNSFGLIAATFFKSLGFIYFILLSFMFLGYYVIDSRHDPTQKTENTIKFIFILLIFVIGGIVPLIIS